MYLTKLELNLKNKRVLHNIANCNWVHKYILEKGFGFIEEKEIRKSINVLYRLEGNILLIQSSVKPEFKNESNMTVAEPKTINIDRMRELFRNGQCVHFECDCNPTKKETSGKRLFLTSQKERTEWLKRTMEANGAEVVIESQSPEKTVWGVKKEGGRTHTIYAKSVKFTGVLKVRDSEKLWNAFCRGIGREKSYGCGMLLITK